MPTQNVPNMTPVPKFPALSERAAGTYNSSAYAFGHHMATTFNAELLAVAGNVKNNADDAKASADTAALSVIAAAAKEAAVAASASAAAASANTAAASAGGQLWVSGTTYAVGALVFSPVTGRNYRRTIAGAGTTDPSADSTNWRAVLLDAYTGVPTIRPTLLLDFANSRRVDPRITFTRASSATRINEKGLIEVVAANVPRIDFDPVTGACKGWLIEESRTNLLTYSEQFDNAAWTKAGATVVANASNAPNGAMTMQLLKEDTSLASHALVRQSSVTAGVKYTYGVHAKYFAGGSKRYLTILLTPAGFGANIRATFDLQAGTFTQVNAPLLVKMVPCADGSYFCSVTHTATTTTATCDIHIRLSEASADTLAAYTGDGASGVYVWGAQLEQGEFPTSYIPTTGAAATRAADVSVMTGSNFSSWYRQDEYTLVAESSSYRPDASYSIVVSVNSTNKVSISRHGTNSRGFGASASIDCGAGTYPPNTVVKQALAARANDFAMSTNGAAVVVDTTTDSMPTDANALSLGCTTEGGSILSGHIRRIAYYNKRLSNAELQALTTP